MPSAATRHDRDARHVVEAEGLGRPLALLDRDGRGDGDFGEVDASKRGE